MKTEEPVPVIAVVEYGWREPDGARRQGAQAFSSQVEAEAYADKQRQATFTTFVTVRKPFLEEL